MTQWTFTVAKIKNVTMSSAFKFQQTFPFLFEIPPRHLSHWLTGKHNQFEHWKPQTGTENLGTSLPERPRDQPDKLILKFESHPLNAGDTDFSNPSAIIIIIIGEREYSDDSSFELLIDSFRSIIITTPTRRRNSVWDELRLRSFGSDGSSSLLSVSAHPPVV